MRILLAWIVVICYLLTSCKTDVKADPLFVELESKVVELEYDIQVLKDSLLLVKYPAGERLSDIEELIANDFLEEALVEIEMLNSLFPLSQESKEAEIQKEIVSEKVNDRLENALKLREAGFTTSYAAYIPACDNPRLERFLELFLETKVLSASPIVTIFTFINLEIEKQKKYSKEE